MSDDDRQEPIWLNAIEANMIHARQLAEHGGGQGIRDAGLLESALARPVNRWTYGDDDPSALAAAFAFGLARNHPYVDGNKRTAWVLARVFLSINGHRLVFAKDGAVTTMLALAAGDLGEAELADWFRQRLAATPDVPAASDS